VKLRSTILASAGALALATFATGAAQAEGDFSGVLSGDYAHIDASGGGGSANSWGINGSGAFGLGDSGLAGEVDGGYARLSGGGVDANDWTIDGSVFWRATQGRIGAVVGYNSSDIGGSGGTFHATNYGAFGEWYAGHSFTVGVKGGGFNGSSSVKGDYLGAAVTAYAMPDLAFQGSYNYLHVNHIGNENDWSIQGEWLVSEQTPVSIFAGYENSDFSGTGHVNTWFIGVKLYTNPNGPAPLVDRQRNGAATWGTQFAPLGFSLL